jgi:hypothetical protein
MAQAVSRRPLMVDDRFRARVSPNGNCGGDFLGFSPSESFYHCSPYSYITLEMNNRPRPVGGHEQREQQNYLFCKFDCRCTQS